MLSFVQQQNDQVKSLRVLNYYQSRWNFEFKKVYNIDPEVRIIISALECSRENWYNKFLVTVLWGLEPTLRGVIFPGSNFPDSWIFNHFLFDINKILHSTLRFKCCMRCHKVISCQLTVESCTTEPYICLLWARK